MLNSFYLNDINTKGSIREALRYIFDRSVFFKSSHREKWNKAIDYIEGKDDMSSFPCANEIDFLKSLIGRSEYYADIFKEYLQIDLSNIHELESDIQNDFKQLLLVSHNLRVGEKPTISMVNRDDSLYELRLNLSRRINNNTLIVGEPGTGKSFLVETFALLYQHNILSINPAFLVGGTKYRGEFEEKISRIFRIISKYRITVFIDEIHTVIGLGGGDGGIDLNNMLKPIIESTDVRLIGATTENEFLLLGKDKAFKRRFTIIRIKEFSSQEISEVFEDLLDNVLLHYPDIMHDSNSFVHYMITKKDTILGLLDAIPESSYPHKLVDFLDYCAASFTQNRDVRDVERCISSIM